jgi:hypothetical protein
MLQPILVHIQSLIHILAFQIWQQIHWFHLNKRIRDVGVRAHVRFMPKTESITNRFENVDQLNQDMLKWIADSRNEAETMKMEITLVGKIISSSISSIETKVKVAMASQTRFLIYNSFIYQNNTRCNFSIFFNRFSW